MYSLEISPALDGKFKRMSKKNRKHLEIIFKKIEEVLRAPHRMKPLSNKMKNFRRVHIDKSFVLIYSIDEKNKSVVLQDFDHHDRIYRR